MVMTVAWCGRCKKGRVVDPMTFDPAAVACSCGACDWHRLPPIGASG